jgi:hypothetical protein
MKANFLFVLLAVVVLASSCKKQNMQPVATPAIPVTTAALLGKWSIAKDSTYIAFIGPPTITVYVGTANDYYDFRADSKCYKHENGVYDTIAYKIASDTSVIFGDPVAYIDANSGKTMYAQRDPTVINPLTAHSAKIVFSYVSPGGPHYNAIYLSK